MRKKISSFMMLTAILMATFLIVSPVSAQIADGTYDVHYEMKEASSDNTSIADGYFTSPAKLTVENGVQHIQLTLTGSDMIQSLTAPSGPVKVLSENAGNKTRVVQFRVDGDLSAPLSMSMHIIVPDLYNQEHTARAVFNTSGLPQAGAADNNTNEASGTEDATNNGGGPGEVVENPKTGENSSMALYGLLMLGSMGGLFTIWKLRPARN